MRGAYILGADVSFVVEEEAGGVRVAAVRRVVERHAAIPLRKGGGQPPRGGSGRGKRNARPQTRKDFLGSSMVWLFIRGGLKWSMPHTSTESGSPRLS